MEDRDTIDLELSVWWGVATVALVLGGGAILIARNIGSQAVETLLYSSLMLLFLAGGVLLGTLATQALGASLKWRLAEDETPLVSSSNKQASLLSMNANSAGDESDSDSKEYERDPFYEILKRNRSQNKAA